MPKIAQVKGLKALLKQRQKYTATTQHGQSTTMTYGNAESSLLTSTTAFTTASETTGLINTDNDKVRIRSIRLRGSYLLQSIATAAGAGHTLPRVRQMVVWFYKPTYGVNISGILPPLSEVLANVTIDAIPETQTQQGGSWVILHDTTYDFGVWMSDANGNHQNGPIAHNFDVNIPVNRSMSFKKPPTAAYPGGHYDTSQDAGQISRGYPILYQYLEGTTTSYSQPILMTTNCQVLYSE